MQNSTWDHMCDIDQNHQTTMLAGIEETIGKLGEF